MSSPTPDLVSKILTAGQRPPTWHIAQSGTLRLPGPCPGDWAPRGRRDFGGTALAPSCDKRL